MSSIYDIGANRAQTQPVTFHAVTFAQDKELRLIEAVMSILGNAEDDAQRGRVLRYVLAREAPAVLVELR